ncbi:hypothetical protein GAY29_10265, partial [Azospirillum brasilense]|uniref:hypothetical protein n=1 Tax=Azospirillum brasilense TaxID=192 RepID=UPI00190BC2E6
MRRVASFLGCLLIVATVAGLAMVAQAAEGPAALPPSVRIKPVMVPIVSRGQVERYTQIEVMLEVANATRLGEVQVAIPRLHDAALRAVYLGIEEGWIVRGNIARGARGLATPLPPGTRKGGPPLAPGPGGI